MYENQQKPADYQFQVFDFSIFSTQSVLNILYALSTLVLGIFFFTYAVTGISLSIGLGVTIFGLPVAYLFLRSIPILMNGFILYTSKMTGIPAEFVRTPHGDGSFFSNIVALAKDKGILISLGFMILSLPAGIFLFTFTVTLLSTSLSLMATVAYPLVKWILALNGIDASPGIYVPAWLIFSSIIGAVIMGYFMFIFTIKIINASVTSLMYWIQDQTDHFVYNVVEYYPVREDSSSEITNVQNVM